MKHFVFINSFENDAVKSLLYAIKFTKYSNATLHIMHLVRSDLGPFLLTSSLYLVSDQSQRYLEGLNQSQIKSINKIKAKILSIAGEDLPVNWRIHRFNKEELLEGIYSMFNEIDVELILIGNYLAAQISNRKTLEMLINETDIPILLIPSFQEFASIRKILFLSEYLMEDLKHIEIIKSLFVNKKCELDIVHFPKDRDDDEPEKNFVKKTLLSLEKKDSKRTKINVKEITEKVAIEKYLDLEFSGFVNENDFLCLSTKKRGFLEVIISKNTSLKFAKKMIVPVLLFRKS